jgi:hypothetical protein
MLEHLTLEVAKLRGPLCFAKSHVVRRDPDPKLDPYKVVAVSVLWSWNTLGPLLLSPTCSIRAQLSSLVDLIAHANPA